MIARQHERAEAEAAMLAEARAEVVAADSKAALFLAAAGIGFGALLSGLISGDWEPDMLKGSGQLVWWVGAAFAISSVMFAALAVWPRYKTSDPAGGVHYWGHVARYKSLDDLGEALDQGRASRHARTRNQLWLLSNIVLRKYRFIRLGLACGGAAVVFLVAAVLLGR